MKAPRKIETKEFGIAPQAPLSNPKTIMVFVIVVLGFVLLFTSILVGRTLTAEFPGGKITIEQPAK